MDDPANQDFSMDNGLVCRWMTGQAKISPKISAYYSKPSNQEKLAHTIHQNLLPLMSDCNMAIQDIYTLFIQDDSISDAKKKNLTPLYKPASSRLLFLAKLISFGMERQFIKRNTKNQKLLFVTSQGMMKIVDTAEFDVAKRTVASTKLQDDDKIVSIEKADVQVETLSKFNLDGSRSEVEEIVSNKNVIVQTANGVFLKFPLSEIPVKKKSAVGVRGIKLGKDDYIEDIFIMDDGMEFTMEYKGKKYPSFLFRKGRPVPEFRRYLQIEKLFIS